MPDQSLKSACHVHRLRFLSSSKIAAQDEGGAGIFAGLCIIALTHPDLGKSEPGIEAARRKIVLIDLEEQRSRAVAGEPVQMHIEELAGWSGSRMCCPQGGGVEHRELRRIVRAGRRHCRRASVDEPHQPGEQLDRQRAANHRRGRIPACCGCASASRR